MAAPRLLSRQEGNFSFPNGSITLQDITITSVTLANSWVEISVRADESDSISNVSYYTTAVLTSSTNLRLQRGGLTRATFVEWVVYEFDSSVNVYRGSFVQSSATVNTTVPSVNLSKSISVATYRTTFGVTTTLNIRNCVLRNRLTTSTELRTNLFVSDASSTVHWQVIEFTTDISVQQFEASNSTWPLNIAITSVDLLKSFIIFSWSSNSSTSLCSEDILSCRLTSSTNVRMEDFFGGVIAKFYNFYVVTYTGSDVFDVSRGYTTMLGTSITPTISTTKSNASLILGHEYNSLLEADVCSRNFRDHGSSSKIDSNVAFTTTRFSGTNEATVAWELVTWASDITAQINVPFFIFRRSSI